LLAICALGCLAAGVNTAKRFEADVARAYGACEKAQQKARLRLAESLCKTCVTENKEYACRNQSAQRASRLGIRLTRKVCDVTIGRAESPVLFRAIRRSREKAATKQEKAPGSQASPSRSHLPAVRAVSSFHAGRSNLSLY